MSEEGQALGCVCAWGWVGGGGGVVWAQTWIPCVITRTFNHLDLSLDSSTCAYL